MADVRDDAVHHEARGGLPGGMQPGQRGKLPGPRGPITDQSKPEEIKHALSQQPPPLAPKLPDPVNPADPRPGDQKPGPSSGPTHPLSEDDKRMVSSQQPTKETNKDKK